MISPDRKILSVPLNEIVMGENTRQEYHPNEMSELMVSMRQTGLMQPIGVRLLTNGKYKIVFGFRRFVAAEKLGWEKIDCVLLDVSDEKDALVKTSIENVQRTNPSLPEQGRVFDSLLKKGLTNGDVAARVGCSKHFVMQALESFYNIPQKYRDKITHGTRGKTHKKGTIPASVALRVSEVKKTARLTAEQTEKIFDWALRDGINMSQVRIAGQMIAGGATVTEAIKKSADTKIVTVAFAMTIANVVKLQKKYEMPIHDIAYIWLEQSDELAVSPLRDRHQKKRVASSMLARNKSKKPILRKRNLGVQGELKVS